MRFALYLYRITFDHPMGDLVLLFKIYHLSRIFMKLNTRWARSNKSVYYFYWDICCYELYKLWEKMDDDLYHYNQSLNLLSLRKGSTSIIILVQFLMGGESIIFKELMIGEYNLKTVMNYASCERRRIMIRVILIKA